MSIAVLERPASAPARWQPTPADPLGVAALNARIRRNDLLRTELKGGKVAFHKSTEKLGAYMRGRLLVRIGMEDRFEPEDERDEGVVIFGGLTCVWTIRDTDGRLPIHARGPLVMTIAVLD